MADLVIIGRFQILTRGHLDLFRQAKRLKPDLLVVCVGSSQQSGTFHDPFSAEERKRMVEAELKKLGVKYKIFLVPDIKKGSYARHVERITGIDNKAIIFSANPYTTRCFKPYGYRVLKPKFRYKIHASEVRDLIIAGKPWKRLVPLAARKVLAEINGVDRIKALKCTK
jgi:nicotinamide-nucleotide adenylyltransferase